MTGIQHPGQRQPGDVIRPQRKWTPGWVIATGVLLAAAGYALGQTTLLVAYKGGTVSQVNGICTSALGQFAQVLRPAAAGGCGQIAMYEQLHGWLIVAGVLTMAGGVAWEIRNRQKGSAGA